MDSEDLAALDFLVGAMADNVGVGRRASVVLTRVLRLEILCAAERVDSLACGVAVAQIRFKLRSGES